MGRKPITETLREVAPNLWVSDIQSARTMGDDFDLVVDCTGYGPTAGNGRTLSITPKGRTNHTWAVGDLDLIATVVGLKLEAGKSVLIHCRRGVSRSATAAAAVLLYIGRAKSRKEAWEMASSDHKASRFSTKSLREWWEIEAERQNQLGFVFENVA